VSGPGGACAGSVGVAIPLLGLMFSSPGFTGQSGVANIGQSGAGLVNWPLLGIWWRSCG
jgi:hypothetical protein